MPTSRVSAMAGSRIPSCRNSEAEIGIEEGRERLHEQLDQRQRKQHRDRRDQDRFADELDDQLPRLAPSTLRSATSRARWLARAVARLVKFTTAMPRISRAMIAKVAIDARSLPGVIDAVLRLAEMDVADIDEVPILVVALIVLDAAVVLVGDVALLPRRHLRIELLHVGARLELREDPARLAAPAGQEFGVRWRRRRRSPAAGSRWP